MELDGRLPVLLLAARSDVRDGEWRDQPSRRTHGRGASDEVDPPADPVARVEKIPLRRDRSPAKPRTRTKKRLRRSARAEEVAQLAVDNTQRQIAEKLGIAQSHVSKLTNQAIAERWENAGEIQIKLRSAKAALLMKEYTRLEDQEARFDAIEKDAHDAWKRSQQEAQKTRSEGRPAGVGPDGKPQTGVSTRVVIEREGQVGDPRFLELLRQCAEGRQRLATRRGELLVKWCEIMGINRPRPWEDDLPTPTGGVEAQAGDSITIFVRGDGRLQREPPSLKPGTNGRSGHVPASDHE